MTAESVALDNPFATRHVRPGAIRYMFTGDQNAEELVRRLQSNAWWGQIVGPHGSGKSSLLATLIPVLTTAGREPLLIELHDGQRRLPPDRTTERWMANVQVIVDGYEQLSRTSRFGLKRRCRLAGCGLMVTAHASVGLPDVMRLDPDLKTAMRLIEFLLGRRTDLITAGDITASYAASGANLREMLFDLYSLYERRRRDLRK